jgi:hypothetical protein
VVPAYLAIVEALSDETSRAPCLLVQRSLVDALGGPFHDAVPVHMSRHAARTSLKGVLDKAHVVVEICENLFRSYLASSAVLKTARDIRLLHSEGSRCLAWGRTLLSAEVRSRPQRPRIRTILSTIFARLEAVHYTYI